MLATCLCLCDTHHQTNVNFDEARFIHMLQQSAGYTKALKDKLAAAGVCVDSCVKFALVHCSSILAPTFAAAACRRDRTPCSLPV